MKSFYVSLTFSDILIAYTVSLSDILTNNSVCDIIKKKQRSVMQHGQFKRDQEFTTQQRLL